MASTFELQSARRKFIYFGLILLLFTGSLLHRKFVVNSLADSLMMRDVSRGKADLTDSAVRLTLTGFRGVAVTSLWMAAIEKQKRHEWNEMEIVVDSLTRLQPRFVAPWLYQGWNLSFNVAVEFDRVRDKYYYIARGINLLARGEEKNDPGQADPPRPWAANPQMRFEIANAYQLKISQSDEGKTQRCLFDLSCIPLSERQPERFYIFEGKSKKLDLDKFKQFCESYPRFVRRLRDRLPGFEKAENVVQFMADNKDIPCRLEDRRNMQENDERRLTEFPVLPPQNVAAVRLCPYPDWRNQQLATSVEDFDVFTCMRAWYTYAQVPLPPENPDPGARQPEFDRLKHRMPRLPTAIIFRTYPARSQAFLAEALQKDGWFDDSGWQITGWFPNPSRKPVTVGASMRYHSGAAWDKAHHLYLNYGKANGIYMEPAEMKKLEEESNRQGPNSFAGKKLLASLYYRSLTNFDDFMRQTDVERTPEAVAARMAIFEVEHIEAANPNVVNIYREKVLPQWLDLLLRYRQFRKVSNIQDETYELQAKYFKLLQYYNRELFERLAVESARALPIWPFPGTLPPLVDGNGTFISMWPSADVVKQSLESQGGRILYIRDVEGPFDQLFVLESPRSEALKPLAVALARSALWPPLPTDANVPDFALARYVGQSATGIPTLSMLSPAEERRILTQSASHREPPSGQGWIPLIPQEVVRHMRESIPWMRVR